MPKLFDELSYEDAFSLIESIKDRTIQMAKDHAIGNQWSADKEIFLLTQIARHHDIDTKAFNKITRLVNNYLSSNNLSRSNVLQLGDVGIKQLENKFDVKEFIDQYLHLSQPSKGPRF